MTPRLLTLALVALGLFAWDRALEARRDEERGERMLVREMTTPEERQAFRVAALVLETGPNAEGKRDSLYYLRSGGLWRCRSVYDVPARTDLVQAALDEATRAEGVIQSPAPLHPERYGFDTHDMLTLRLHGPQLKLPDQDLQYSLEVGYSIPGFDGCYVRRVGEQAIWAIDTDLRATIDWSGAGDLPPMLDSFVVPTSWMQNAENLLRILTKRTSGTDFELVLSFSSPAEIERGAPEWQWRLRNGGEDTGVNPVLGVGYNLFVQRTPYVAIADPARAQELVGDRLQGRITLVPRVGEPLELLIGQPLGNGAVPVYNRTFKLLYLVEGKVGALLLPELSAFDDAGSGLNPWDEFLHER